MYCKQCGNQLSDGASFCPKCGALQTINNNSSTYNSNGSSAYVGTQRPATFTEAVKSYFNNYTNFTGRATRSEFWWGFLFTYLLCLTVIGVFVALIPTLSLCIRRLHDIGKAWYWYLLGLIPYVGGIILIVFYCMPSVGDNQWGPAPY